MEYESREDFIIKKYQQDEETMVRLFVQWCVNHKLDPLAIYMAAYPAQQPNELLKTALEETEAFEHDISGDILLEVLQSFGNDDLAFEVAKEMEKLPRTDTE
ncbi:hypothetical protein [Planococcus sp. ISL-109]|uniref:hypothetical protein n=1 Tax=Planococcus sp. ISL-109 TaxID=2819166 RepID=UPI001BE63AB7|nr:hypothetical protein [Planococcus sp. ISL-109]MBT2581422.1 hypothetical protein [Planococcus sp. ISL-109]